MKKKLAAISPLGLLTLAACGGGGGVGPIGISFAGNAVKGPLDNALVFIDLNNNLRWDEGVDTEKFETDETGAFSFSNVVIPDGVTPNIVVISSKTTVDTSSGLIVGENFKLTAPGDTTKSTGLAVTPVTTLLTSGDLTQEQLAAALGLEGIEDLLSYNPYTDSNPDRALQAEKTAHQVMNVISTLQVAGEVAGLTAEAALNSSLKAFTAVIKVADASNSEVNLSDATNGNAVGLDAISDSFVGFIEDAATELALTDADAANALTAKINNYKTVAADVLKGVEIVNDLVASAELVDGVLPTDLSNFVSTTNKLVSDVAAAVDLGNTNTFYIKDAVSALNVAKNKAATEITLSPPQVQVEGIVFDEGGGITIKENIASGTIVAMVSSDDSGALTYDVTSSDPTVAKYFEIIEDQYGVKLVVADGVVIDYEEHSELSITLSVEDTYGKGFTKAFKLSVSDEDEDPEISTAEFSLTQGGELNQKLLIVDPEGREITAELVTDSDLFSLNGAVLSTKRSVTQADVDLGEISLSIALTDVVSGKTIFQTVTVSIENLNDAPKFTTNSILGGTEGKAYSQKINASDADGDDVTFELIDEPTWLSISADGILSGVVPSDDTKISVPETITVKAIDGQGGETIKDFVLEYTNINDAPAFAADKIEAIVVETKDEIGIESPKESDRLSGTIVFNDADDDLGNLTLSLVGADAPRSDGKIVLTGDYGELVFDPTDYTYVYTPDVEKIEPLYAQTVKDAFVFKIFDDEGASDSLTLNVNVTGAEDNPRLAGASDQDFIVLGNNQSGTVVGEINVFDGSQYAGFALAPVTTANDNDKFERTLSGKLKLKDNVTTNFEQQNQYVVEVFAQDYSASGEEIEGTKSSKTASFTIKVNATDPAPQVITVDTDYAGDILAIGEVLNFTVTLSEAAKAGGTTTMTLSNGARVTLSVGASNSQYLTGQYEVQEGDEDAGSSNPLEINSISAGTITDINDQGLSEQTVFDDLGGIQVDANAPTAKLLGTEQDPHKYDPTTGTLTLKGASLGTILSGTSRDVVDIVDWSKLSWNVDGLGSTILKFSASYVTSALVNADGTSITIKLSSAGMSALHALTDFGGVEASGGTPDALNVTSGFLRDLAGNVTTSASTVLSEVFITDQTPPALSSIEINGAFTSTAGAGRSAGATFIVGDTLKFTAIISEGSDLASVANMQVTLTLSNNKQLKLVRAANADGSVKTFSGQYVISEDDSDVSSLTLKSYALVNIKDIAGNVATNDVLLADVDVLYTGAAIEGAIKIDATSPTAKLLGTNELPHTYDAVNGVLKLQGEGLKTILAAADNFEVKTIVDWSKLTWNVDGEGAATYQFSKTDITSALVNVAGTVLTVSLSETGMSNLHSLDGFGGTAATGGVVDAIEVDPGFLKDASGNLSTETSTVASEVALDDKTALVLSSVTYDGQPNARIGEGQSIGFKALFTDPVPATGSELADDAELVLTLNNGVNVTLTKSSEVGEELYLVGAYKVQAQDDTLDENGEIGLEIVSVDAGEVYDVAGNKADATSALSKVDLGEYAVILDTIAPQVDQVIFNSSESELVFVFKELLSESSITSSSSIMQGLDGVVSVTSSGDKNTTITTKFVDGTSFQVGDEIDFDPLSFVDLAGNAEDIYYVEIGALIA